MEGLKRIHLPNYIHQTGGTNSGGFYIEHASFFGVDYPLCKTHIGFGVTLFTFTESRQVPIYMKETIIKNELYKLLNKWKN